jgi:hypothetical protein
MAGNDSTQIHSREFSRVLPLIIALERIQRPTMTNLATDTGLTEKQLESRLQALQGDYHVLIERSGDVHHVASWGLLPRQQRSEVERGVFSVKRDNPQDEQIIFDIANNRLRIYGHRIAFTASLDAVELIKEFSEEGGQLRISSADFCANVQLSLAETWQAEHYFLVIKKSQETMK